MAWRPAKWISALRAIGGTRRVDAAVSDFIFRLVNPAAAFRALFRHVERFFFLAMLHHLEHVRNHFAGALDEHGVAFVNIQPLDFVHVVQTWSVKP